MWEYWGWLLRLPAQPEPQQTTLAEAVQQAYRPEPPPSTEQPRDLW